MFGLGDSSLNKPAGDISAFLSKAGRFPLPFLRLRGLKPGGRQERSPCRPQPSQKPTWGAAWEGRHYWGCFW